VQRELEGIRVAAASRECSEFESDVCTEDDGEYSSHDGGEQDDEDRLGDDRVLYQSLKVIWTHQVVYYNPNRLAPHHMTLLCSPRIWKRSRMSCHLYAWI
jgi:hypothetical protein